MIHRGSRVEFEGLKVRPQLNGKLGTCRPTNMTREEFACQGDALRCKVELDDGSVQVLVKPENIRVLEPWRQAEQVGRVSAAWLGHGNSPEGWVCSEFLKEKRRLGTGTRGASDDSSGGEGGGGGANSSGSSSVKASAGVPEEPLKVEKMATTADAASGGGGVAGSAEAKKKRGETEATTAATRPTGGDYGGGGEGGAAAEDGQEEPPPCDLTFRNTTIAVGGWNHAVVQRFGGAEQLLQYMNEKRARVQRLKIMSAAEYELVLRECDLEAQP